ncbi:MAG: PLP-dependent aspartate aminotransferase family protein [Spirochaetaceae bacterium]|jgi:cystathionine gamma-synthase|nr:PLP-dependent aspartate aminotransferase family protein [Spirochaetaceae bacterium]
METETQNKEKPDAPVNARRGYALDTLAARQSHFFEPRTGAVCTPIFQSAAFRHPALGESTGFDYSRCGNPTRQELEETIALLEGAKYGLAFASGMGAISSIIKIFKPGAHIIVSEDLYGGTYRLFNSYYSSYGYSFSFVDTSDFSKIEKAFLPQTKGIFIETPSNPMMKITDIKMCAGFIHQKGGLLIADNTFCTPYFQNPLALGADFVVHSGSKYLEGHNDTLCGFIAHSKDEYEQPLRDAQMSEGAVLSPFDSYLTLRGIKTLALRMEKHWSNALAVAKWLQTNSKVKAVFYTGLESHPQYALSQKQSRGHSGMISFYVKDIRDVKKLLSGVRLILFAESLGGVESLITYPWVQTHEAIPEDMRRRAGVTEELVRLSIGLENPADLIADLEQAFEGGAAGEK